MPAPRTVRITFLANPVHDYLQDTVFHGLVSLLGPENVVEFPRLDRYHSPPPDDALHPDLWFEFPEPRRPRTFANAVRSSDAVVIGSLRSGIRALVGDLLAMRHRPPVVFLDGEDDFFVLGVRRHVDLYFKREIVLPGTASRAREVLRRAHRAARKHREHRDPLADPVSVARVGDRRLRPLTFGWLGPTLERRAVDYDVAFLVGPTSPVRIAVQRDLRQLAAEGVRVRLLEPGERLGWHEYMQVLAHSRIGVSIRGGGFDTRRYWEVPAAGAMLLSETPRIVIPSNFVNGREAVMSPPSRLVARIPELLEADIESIAAAGRRRLEAAHLSVHRARTVLDALAERP